MSYENEIKKELFGKIQEWNKVNEKICLMESKACNLPTDDLIKNDEYSEFLIEQLGIENEIEELMIETRYFPLFGLTKEQKNELDFFSMSSSLDEDKNIEKHLDSRLESLRIGMRERIKKVKSLHLTIEGNPRIYFLYEEVIKCYVYGVFEASCAFCRVITEAVANKYIGKSKYKHLIGYCGEEKSREDKPSLGKIFKMLSVDKKAVDAFYEIQSKADEILHEKDKKTGEEEAFGMINQLQIFIKKLYKDPDLSIEEV